MVQEVIKEVGGSDSRIDQKRLIRQNQDLLHHLMSSDFCRNSLRELRLLQVCLLQLQVRLPGTTQLLQRVPHNVLESILARKHPLLQYPRAQSEALRAEAIKKAAR